MRIDNLEKSKIDDFYKGIDSYLTNLEQKWIKYIDLGCKIVRIISYSDEFLPHIEKQLTFILRDNSPKYDETLILWKETDVLAFSKKLVLVNQDIATKIRFEYTYRKARKTRIETLDELYDLQIIDKGFSNTKPAIDIQTTRGFVYANNKDKHTYYYGVNNLEAEEFIKEGHLFVQFFNNILKTETSNLAHGAVIGLNGNGICFCARGQRGKSTLSVLSMMEGFEYVSDDYLILHQNKKNELLSSPIYSIITLSPKMYGELYSRLSGSQFVSNNARKDKYVFNISNFHDRFKMNYPIKLCIFPEIVTDKEPSIRPCTSAEKGRAMVQLIQSTLAQTQDMCENWTVKKMMDMIKDYPYYKFNLCHNIEKNTEFLRDFMNNFNKTEHKIIESDKIAIDITFDLANILNTQSGIIYFMNYFATNIYENLLKGVSKEAIQAELMQFSDENINIKRDFELFIQTLEEKEIFKYVNTNNFNVQINKEYAKENNYRLSFVECLEEKYNELIKENKNDKLCIK